MLREPCTGTEDGEHVLLRVSIRTELLSLGGLNILAVAATCGACGLHCGWVVDVPSELTWTTEPRSLDAIAKRWSQLAPKAKLTLIDGGKKDE